MTVGFTTPLVRWFEHHARVLPWRTERTGYRVWVSEIMLQQTQVATVVPYFERFMVRFPDVGALAAADAGDVLALWSGLGYYRRARALHEASRVVVERFGGDVPETVEELRSLPGIGRYTAGAIASMAFGVHAALVDGNVARVLSRWLGLSEDPASAMGQRALWSAAERLLPADGPGAFNEALMELGATVCTPRDPACDTCPVRRGCFARSRGLVARLPRVAKKKRPREVSAVALLARRGGEVLLGRRRTGGLFGGMWEPPMTEASSREAASADSSRFAGKTTPAGEVVHVLSHRRLQVQVLRGAPRPRAQYPEVYEEVRYIAESQLSLYGTSTLARKIMKLGEGEST